MLLRWTLCWIAALWVVLVGGPLGAREILHFKSEVEVRRDGEFLVTETITVRADGVSIRHGIYRDFPTQFLDTDGTFASVGFKLIAARRDGAKEAARVEWGPAAVRIYLGSADVELAPGVYSYELVYRTDRQMRFFDDHDEVYWNATGNEWNFPIRQAEAVIRLPEGGVAGRAAAYTGPYGVRGPDARIAYSADWREVRFVTTRSLRPREGLSVVVSLPKGVVQPPTAVQEWGWFLRDHLAVLIAWAGTVSVAIYYLIPWWHVGRDPPKGLIVPRWDAPEGISPALAHYIWYRGLRRQGFPAMAASILNLAVKGFIEIDDISDTVTLRATEKPDAGQRPPVGEVEILLRLRSRLKGLTISEANGSEIAALGQVFRRKMEKEHREVYYRHNHGWVTAGVAMSALVVAATLVLGEPVGRSLIMVPIVVVVGALLTMFIKGLAREWGTSLAGSLILLIFGFIGVAIVLNTGLIGLAGSALGLDDPLLIGALATLILVNLLFYILLGAPTPLGRKRTDAIAGLHQYLSVAEEDRLNLAGAPAMSPEHFETLLPYAVALGVEKPWTRAFDRWLAAAVATGSLAAGTYVPRWYHGDFGAEVLGQRFERLGSALSKSLTTALPAPKASSSGFRGGFSGGGGGGGGGGGW